jgi:hypothetical protein
MFTICSGSAGSLASSNSVSESSGTGNGTSVGSTLTARGFLARDETVEESIPDLTDSCEFLVVRLNGGFAACTLEEPCTVCAFLVAFACEGVGLEILTTSLFEI